MYDRPNRLRPLRVRRGLSQAALAELTGMSQAHLSRIERGAALPDVKNAFALACALGVAVEQVFEEYYIEATSCVVEYRVWHSK